MRPMGVITCAAPMNTSSNVTYTHKKFKRAPIEASEALDHQHAHHPPREAPAGPVKTASHCIEAPLTPTNGLLVTTPASTPTAATSPAAPEGEEARRRNGRGGKYKCEYCGMGCAKPSVLDKHKRTHTNERPYSCNQCSTAFKTKSNYLKHTRSRSHAQRRDGPEGSDGAAESGDNGDGDEGTGQPGGQQCLAVDVSLPRHSDPAGSSLAAQGPQETSRDQGGFIYKPKKFRVRQPYSTGEEEASPPRAEHRAAPPKDPPDGYSAITTPTYHAPASTLGYPGAHSGHPGHPGRHVRLPQEVRPPSRKEEGNLTGSCSSSPSLKSVNLWKGIEPPSPEVVTQHINKLIVENEAIIETHNPLWPRRYKRQPSLGSSSSESESSGSSSSRRGSLADPGTKSSKGSIPAPPLQGQLRERSHSHTSETMMAESRCPYSPRLPPATPHLPLAQPTASASKPSISLPGLTTSYSQSPPPLEPGLYDASRKRCQSEGPGAPRDLTKGRPARPLEDQAELLRQQHPRNPEGSVIKNLLLGPHGSVDQRGRFIPHGETGPFPCPRCREPCRTLEERDIHMHNFCGRRSGPGSERGTPDLTKNGESGRWVGEQDVALDLHVKPDSVDPERCPSRDSCGRETLPQEPHLQQQQSPKVYRSRSAPEGSLPPVKKRKRSVPDERSSAFLPKGLEAGKLNNHQLFGGEVQICDGHERKTMRIDPGQPPSPGLDICIPPQQLGGGGMVKAEASVPTSVVVTMAKSSLHSGGTMVQVESQLSTSTKTTPSLLAATPLHKEQPSPNIAKVAHTPSLYTAEGGQFSSFPCFTEFAPHLQLPNLAIPGIPAPDLANLSLSSYSPRVPNSSLLHAQATLPHHNMLNNHKHNPARSPAGLPKASHTPPFPGGQGHLSSGVIHGGASRIPGPEAESNLSQPRGKEKETLVTKGLIKGTGQGFPTLIPFGDTKVPHVPGIPGPYSQSSSVCPSPSASQRRLPPVFTHPSQVPVTLSSCVTSVPVNSLRETSLAVPRLRDPPRSPVRERGLAGGIAIRLPHHLSPKDLVSPRPRPSIASPRLPDLKPINPETKLPPAPPEGKVSERPTASPELQQLDASVNSDTNDQDEFPTRKRPDFLALKPQPFVPKSSLALMGTTLVSPDTPRPKKSCVQMFLNGSAYTYLGHKVSTKTYYCCIYRQQPMYAPQGPNSKLSMYSNWQIKPEDPSKPYPAMSLYQSYKRDHRFTIAQPKELDLIQTHSSYWTFKQEKEKRKEEEAKPGEKDAPEIKSEESDGAGSSKASEGSPAEATGVFIKREAEDAGGECPGRSSDDSEGSDGFSINKRVKIFEGGFKSTEDYTYVRGRGRGRYVCGTCGIRCKKPSMLRKHCRTHTDLRPYACSHCSFSFKTKGNLTKHLRSKAHYKRCVEMGVVPVPTVVDESHVNEAALALQDKLEQERKPDGLEEDDDDDDDDDEEEDMDDDDEEEDDEAGMEGHQFRDAHDHLSQGIVALGTSLRSLGTTITRAAEVAGTPGSPAARSGVLVMQHPSTPPSFTSSTSSNSSSSSPPSSTSTITSIVTAISSSSSSSTTSTFICSPASRGESSREGPMDLSVRRGAAGWAADKAAPHRPSFLPVLSRPSLLESPGMAASPSTPIREHPSDILSPVTESSSLLKSIYQTTERAAQVTSVTLDPSTESGSSRSMLHAYLRERAVLDTAIKRQQYSFSSDASPGSSHLPPGESQPQPQEQGPAEAHEGKGGEKVSSQAPLITTPNTTITSSTSTTTSALTLTPTMTSTTTSTATIVTSIQLSSSTVNSTSRMPTPPANLTVMNSGRGLDTKTAFLVPSGVLPSSLNRLTSDDGKCKCTFCHKEFNRPAQLSLHMNIHYMERPFRCDSCAVSFRTNGHLQKHKRSVGHFNKVNMNMTFGTPSTDNPRPFKCHDCKIAFRIHGHLAKHLRSKMHIMKLECLGKLPFGTYAEIERSGANLNEIDTTDCDNSLESLQAMASRLYEKDPTKLAAWKTQEDPPHHRVRTVSNSSTNSDDYPLQDDQDDPMAGCGHDEDTEGDDDEEVAGPRDGAGHGSLPGGAGDTHTQALPSTEMGLSPPASLLACHLCQEKFFEPEHLSSHLYSVHKVSVTYRNS